MQCFDCEYYDGMESWNNPPTVKCKKPVSISGVDPTKGCLWHKVRKKPKKSAPAHTTGSLF